MEGSSIFCTSSEVVSFSVILVTVISCTVLPCFEMRLGGSVGFLIQSVGQINHLIIDVHDPLALIDVQHVHVVTPESFVRHIDAIM